MLRIYIINFIFFLSSLSYGWGGRGHNTICEAATFLVSDANLKDFLTFRPHVMGHLCNIPDIHWKDMGGDAVKIGSPTHYFDIDLLDGSIEKVPLSFSELEKTLTGKQKKVGSGTIKSVAQEVGSLWWRADQFFRLAVQTPEKWKSITPPSNRLEEQNSEFAYNQVIYNFMVHLGLMGHYIGDITQPLHNTADFDGWHSGHGGLHSYYEEQVVAKIDQQLFSKVFQEGTRLIALSKNKKTQSEVPFVTHSNVIEKCRALALLAKNDLTKLLKLDQILEPSNIKNEKGMEIKIPAKRKEAAQTARRFEKLIIQQMGRSAATLASLWDEAYRQAGRPNLSTYKSFRYPLKPDFIFPDYLSQTKE